MDVPQPPKLPPPADEPYDKANFQAEMPYAGMVPGELTTQQENFVHLYVSGMSQAAAAVAVGASGTTGNKWCSLPQVKTAIEYFRNKNRQRLEFTVETAHKMYMDAYAMCADATEMKMVIDSLVKLHGVAAQPKPLDVNVNINNPRSLERASDTKLLELAGQDPNYLLPQRPEKKKLVEAAEPIEAEYSEVKK